MRLLFGILALLLAACGGPGEPARVDGSVVLFAPSMTEAACALGYADRIVAITDYDRWPPEILDRPRVGGAIDPDLERLAVLNPDLLVLQGEADILHRFADERGIRVEDVKMDDELESILQGILRLDEILGGPGSRRGQELVGRIRAGLDSIAARSPADSAEVLLVLSRNPHTVDGIFTAGTGTFFDDLLKIAGATNWAAARGKGYFEAPLDLIVADPPDIVVEYAPAIDDSEEERERAWAALPGTPPEVRVIRFDGFMIPGPRVVESARALAEALSPGP